MPALNNKEKKTLRKIKHILGEDGHSNLSKQGPSNCYLMHKNTKVLEMYGDAEYVYDVNKILNKEHLPFSVKIRNGKVNLKSLRTWWESRCIPESRRLTGRTVSTRGLSLSFITRNYINHSLGLNLTDGYWIRYISDDSSWDKLNFFKNHFSPDFGEFSTIHNFSSYIPQNNARDVFEKYSYKFGKGPDTFNKSSPDITTNGRLRKRWVRDGGKLFLQKWGSPYDFQEPYNELVATKIMKRLGIKHVKYSFFFEKGMEQWKPYPYNICENFINIDTEFIPAEHIISKFKKPKNVSIYEFMIKCYEKLGIQNAREALDQMIVVDYLISNFDRHYGNFGIIRDSNNLQILGVAPIFDSGSSFWMFNRPDVENLEEYNAGTFATTHDEQIKLVSSFDWLNLDLLDGIIPEMEELFNNKVFHFDEKNEFIVHNFKIKIEKLKEIVTKSKK